jgi:hypothetical protein
MNRVDNMANAHESQLTFGQDRLAALHSLVDNIILTTQAIGRMLIYTMCRKATASFYVPKKYSGNSAHCLVGIWASVGGRSRLRDVQADSARQAKSRNRI